MTNSRNPCWLSSCPLVQNSTRAYKLFSQMLFPCRIAQPCNLLVTLVKRLVCPGRFFAMLIVVG